MWMDGYCTIDELDEEIRRDIRRDKREAILETVAQELDDRDRWAGIFAHSLGRRHDPMLSGHTTIFH